MIELEDTAEAYNQDYQHPKFDLPWRKFDWSVLYVNALLWLNKDDKILDLGCGCGQFGQMLNELGFQYYHGVDFSEVAIEKAAKLCPKGLYQQWDIYEVVKHIWNWADSPTVIVAFEVFEHIRDLEVLDKLCQYKPGCKIIVSVPTQPARGHLRIFKSKREVLRHYKNHIDIQQIKFIEQWYLFTGTLK